jgi:cyclopropane fatty-acyl-phospholipid synthase-like methyltransferase
MFSKKEIERYYDLSEVHYRFFWKLDKSKSLHYGYWDHTTENFHEALLNINKILSDKAHITKKDTVLDAGCGIGGSSVWLGKQTGCNVTGISLSEKQVAKANRLAEKEGVGQWVHFFKKDYISTGLEDESFDVVWAIESVCHAHDKAEFLKEAFRLLKKGGRLIIADFFKKENLEGKNAAIISQWAHGWAVPDFSTIEEFEKQLHQTRFDNVQIQDATSNVAPSAKRLYKAYFLGKFLAWLYELSSKKITPTSKKNVETAYLQYKGLKKELWKYKIVYAEKTAFPNSSLEGTASFIIN